MTVIDLDKTTVPGPHLPMPAARHHITRSYSRYDNPIILHWRDTWHIWDDGRWVPTDERTIRSNAYTAFESASYETVNSKGDAETKPWNPNRRKIADLLDASAAVVNLPADVSDRTWIEHGGTRWNAIAATVGLTNPTDLIPLQDGLLHIPTRELHPLSPNLFVLSRVRLQWRYSRSTAFHGDFEPDTTPHTWTNFVRELWPDDPDAINLLQEWFGYVISGDTRQQKMLLLVGPRRGGKGTIARILTELIGAENVAAPTLPGLGSNFGLSSLIGRTLAIIGDARFAGRDTDQVVERLLRISGEDAVDVDRKHKPIWSGRLSTRIMLLANETPRLGDASAAIASRFLPLRLTETWLGREDHTLIEKMLPELPGILRWALDGLDRLRENGRFTEPESAAQLINELEELASPIGQFVTDRCHLDTTQRIEAGELYEEFRGWCRQHGWERIPTRQIFGRDLRAAFPRLRLTQPSEGPRGQQRRHRVYVGISIIEKPTCQVCGRPLDPVLAASGTTNHANCIPTNGKPEDPKEAVNEFDTLNRPIDY